MFRRREKRVPRSAFFVSGRGSSDSKEKTVGKQPKGGKEKTYQKRS